ncbi:O-antigen ligase family protein [Saccharicrinis aurantiacus]|uniref:O-antigen ligase family protein n=1 Tax=Saccharicrinis aurantiacus TaxID=1849719 RepID=UPI002492AA75|nr:O-antigen ligase family protein [Saccharicrinis aurantiacus]
MSKFDWSKLNIKINEGDVVLFLFCFFVGMDLPQIGGSLRVSFIPIMLYSIKFLNRDELLYDRSIALIVLFAIALLPPVLFSPTKVKSFIYIIWVFISYFCIFTYFRESAKRSTSRTLLIIVYCYRFQIILAALIWGAGLQERAQLFYFEPSYFAISLILYTSYVIINFFNKGLKKSLLDIFLILVVLISTQSANYMLIMLMVFLFYYVFKKKSVREITYLIIASCLAFIGVYYYIQYSEDLLASTIRMVIESEDLRETLIGRAGNRWPRVQLGIQTIKENFFGIGMGASRDNPRQYFYNVDPSIESPYDKPVINMYIELIAEGGWIAFGIFALFLVNIVRSSLRIKNTLYKKIFSTALLTVLFIMNFESSILRPYIWMLYGLAVGAEIYYSKQGNLANKNE